MLTAAISDINLDPIEASEEEPLPANLWLIYRPQQGGYFCFRPCGTGGACTCSVRFGYDQSETALMGFVHRDLIPVSESETAQFETCSFERAMGHASDQGQDYLLIVSNWQDGFRLVRVPNEPD